MKVDNLIESITRISDEEQAIRKNFGEESSIHFFGIEREIAALKTALLAEQHRQEAVKTGSSSAYKAFCRVLKGAANDSLRVAWKDGEDRLCACNGHVAVRLRDAHFTVPMAEKPAINLDTLFGDVVDTDRITEDITPTAADFRAYQKKIVSEYKARYSAKQIKNLPYGIPHYYKFDQGPSVNTQYLIDVLEMIPDAVFKWDTRLYKAIYAAGEAGEALVMPCMLRDSTLDQAERDSASLRGGTYFAA